MLGTREDGGENIFRAQIRNKGNPLQKKIFMNIVSS